MRTMTFILFLSIFFTIYGLLNFYIFLRGLQAIPVTSTLRHAYTVVFWCVALSFIAGRVLENYWPTLLTDTLIWMGSFWIAAMLYFFLEVVLLDILRGLNYFLPLIPQSVSSQYAEAKYFSAAAGIGVVSCLLLAGHINALIPRITPLNLSISKKPPATKSLNLVVASDIHLGTIVGRHRFDQIVDSMNALNPDLILLPGDIVDEDLAPVIRQNIGESLRRLRSKYGVYAVTGNHEYIGGVERACRYLSEHNVTVLRDAAVKINGDIYLVGREDRSYNRGHQRQRKSLDEIMAGVDTHFPVILMDHQPFGLSEAAQHGVDLQLSGHTHHGQLWPINYLINAIFEVGWGYRKIGSTNYYVSNGVGTWGPPVRIGNRPEILNIHLSFE